MASVSNINYISIDDTYPLAGRDNDSQGFRDNFNYIKTNFQTAKSEIEDLLANTARTDQATDFNKSEISRANFKNCTEQVNSEITVSSSASVDFSLGGYQFFKAISNNITLSLINLPSSGTAGKVRVHLTGNNVQNMVSFSVSGGGSLKMSSAATALVAPIVCSATETTSDYITCASTANLKVNQPIRFSGTSIDSNILTGIIYYVKYLNPSNTTQFKISAQIDNGVAGDIKNLTGGGSGSTMYIAPTIIAESSTDPLVFDFWTTTGGATVYMDYLGKFV